MATIVCTPHHSRVLSDRAARRARRLASEQTYCETVVTSALKALFLGWQERPLSNQALGRA